MNDDINPEVQSLPLHAWPAVLTKLASAMYARNAHPAHCVVILPYAQLMPVAAQAWSIFRPDGFSPRFETTRNWATALGEPDAGADDLSLDRARDRLVAQSLLERAGLTAQRDLLVDSLIDAAQSLVPVVSAIEPSKRLDWAGETGAGLGAGLDKELMALEAAVARIALAWAASSAYPTDVLFELRVAKSLECVVLCQGFSSDPLHAALQAHWGPRAETLSLAHCFQTMPWQTGAISLHAARDAEDEAGLTAACVLQHLRAGRVPVALPAVDRQLTRRVRAMLAARDVPVRDETGWKLSTTRAAAGVMATLRACEGRADCDAVLDWLKNSPAFSREPVQALERALRRDSARDWMSAQARLQARNADDHAWLVGVEALRQRLSGARPLAQWLIRLREVLQGAGQWAGLQVDPAGAELIRVLRLNEGAAQEFDAMPAACRRFGLADFTDWVQQTLEAASYVPAHTGGEPVVILPLSQLLARPFAALVLAGCDEQRLPLSPEPPGPWTAEQRQVIGLQPREALAQAMQAAWQHGLQTAKVDLLWRTSDDGGETLLPSALVRLLRAPAVHETSAPSLAASSPAAPSDRAEPLSALPPVITLIEAPDPREQRPVTPRPVARPLPIGATLVPGSLSASAYADLRACPYRFFALRQLGLSEVDEIDTELDKRDFGQWLHELLRISHEGERDQPASDAVTRLQLLDDAARAATALRQLDEADFMPFAAAWPRVRDGYLKWLEGFEKEGARFEQAELDCTVPLGQISLKGRIDRTDRLTDGQLMVLDYKTESLSRSRERIKQPTEDTQLLFYAALQDADTLRAAYVNVGEKDGTHLVEQPEVVAARDLLIAGVLHDMERITAGQPLPALGEGMVCDTCAARGLCRKDSWS